MVIDDDGTAYPVKRGRGLYYKTHWRPIGKIPLELIYRAGVRLPLLVTGGEVKEGASVKKLSDIEYRHYYA